MYVYMYVCLLVEDEPWREEVFMLEVVAVLQVLCMYVYMYVCMCVCIYTEDVYIHGRGGIYARSRGCAPGTVYVCMYVCIYVCMCVCVHIY